MGKATGFLEYTREGTRYRCVESRVRDWSPVQLDAPDEQVRRQAARCRRYPPGLSPTTRLNALLKAASEP